MRALSLVPADRCCRPSAAAAARPTAAADGRIRITVTTSGADPQSEEYLVTLDGDRPLVGRPQRLHRLRRGARRHPRRPPLLPSPTTARSAAAPARRSVTVRGGGLSEISFSVVLRAADHRRLPHRGDHHRHADRRGWLPALGRRARRCARSRSTPRRAYQGLDPGAHLVTLKDVADFCDVAGGNPQPYTVVPGEDGAGGDSRGVRRTRPVSRRGLAATTVIRRRLSALKRSEETPMLDVAPSLRSG